MFTSWRTRRTAVKEVETIIAVPGSGGSWFRWWVLCSGSKCPLVPVPIHRSS